MYEAFEKVRKSILTCKTKKQLLNARKLAIYFYRIYESKELFESISRVYSVKMGDFEWF